MRVRGAALAAACLGALALPGTALAQATRTWVSGVGDDANPCSRTAPCKTLAGTISKTAANGEINVTDSGNFGAITITKSITIVSTGIQGTVETTGGTVAFSVNNPGVKVTIRGFLIDGTGATSFGVRVLGGSEVRLEDDDISGFTTAGIEYAPTDASSHLFVENTTVHDNAGDGLLAAPPVTNAQTVVLSDDSFDGNACGVVAASTGIQGTPDFTNDCGTNGSGTNGTTQLTMSGGSASYETGTGLLVNGSGVSATIASDVFDGSGAGLQELNGGTITSFGGNQIYGNTTTGSPTTEINPDLGPTGPAGSTGATGSTGSTGTTGPGGSAGPPGSAGRGVLLTCATKTLTTTVRRKRVKTTSTSCKAKGLSGRSKFKGGSSAVNAKLLDGRKTIATGTALITGTTMRVVLRVSRVPKGSYTLALSRHRRLAITVK
jgi:hypothetical protein